MLGTISKFSVKAFRFITKVALPALWNFLFLTSLPTAAVLALKSLTHKSIEEETIQEFKNRFMQLGANDFQKIGKFLSTRVKTHDAEITRPSFLPPTVFEDFPEEENVFAIKGSIVNYNPAEGLIAEVAIDSPEFNSGSELVAGTLVRDDIRAEIAIDNPGFNNDGELVAGRFARADVVLYRPNSRTTCFFL